jgi:hypothetical protein
MVMSAANAVDDNNDAAPAATRDLRYASASPFGAVRQATEASQPELNAGRWHRILKRRLTLILKVDNPLRLFFVDGIGRTKTRRTSPQSLTM